MVFHKQSRHFFRQKKETFLLNICYPLLTPQFVHATFFFPAFALIVFGTLCKSKSVDHQFQIGLVRARACIGRPIQIPLPFWLGCYGV